jgi:hypothetical protein
MCFKFLKFSITHERQKIPKCDFVLLHREDFSTFIYIVNWLILRMSSLFYWERKMDNAPLWLSTYVGVVRVGVALSDIPKVGFATAYNQIGVPATEMILIIPVQKYRYESKMTLKILWNTNWKEYWSVRVENLDTWPTHEKQTVTGVTDALSKWPHPLL